ncbi:ABC transporter substrate-binding protein [Azospirillum sp. SYSU D00513]|uniref:ABC transporter substrate-binding protein n=1 Tax=Azospirillum sp. SYSU D00513 TaxID=2812561 RepID=UPI001A961744|nr:ABC transporter substrate-binding protein [Azospirillum sp. SYSU D00513]
MHRGPNRAARRLPLAVLAAALLIPALPAQAAPDKPVIALSNSYYGNTWRRQMVESFEAAATQAKQEGKIADYVVVNGDGSANQQMSQMADLILRKVDVIAINAASETALNGIIQKACQAGITVVAFDSLVSAPCAYTLGFDFRKYQADMAHEIAKRLNGQGNVIVVRGVKGSAPDNEMHAGHMEALQSYPGIKVVATVYGQATTSTAQSAVANVLPSLPTVDAVLAQGGGDDFGIAQAFEQYGGAYEKKMPIISGGGSSNFIQWWNAQRKKNGYSTISMNTTPGIGGAAFWLSYEITKGAKPPKAMTMPVAVVDEKNLDDYASMPAGTIVSPTFTQGWVRETLLAQPQAAAK